MAELKSTKSSLDQIVVNQSGAELTISGEQKSLDTVIDTKMSSANTAENTCNKSMVLNGLNGVMNGVMNNQVVEPTPPQGIADRCQTYSQTKDKKIAWRQDVNLLPPRNKDMKDHQEVEAFYNSLQYVLYETGCLETIDRTPHPRSGSNVHGAHVCILSAPRECMGILLEGGNYCSDTFHLVLSPSWLSKVPSTTAPGLFTLYINKAITFHEGGVTFIDEFKEPRRVTYLLNYYTEAITSGFIKDQGENIETNLDCPMSTSLPLCRLVDNKVWTRSMMIEAEVDVPISLAFLYKCKPFQLVSDPKLAVFWYDRKPTKMEITERVKSFLSQSFITAKKIVVKPSGPMCFASYGVSFHDPSSIGPISDAVEKLFETLEDECAVLVETFVEPVKPKQGQLSWGAKPSESTRVRATVCRDHDNVPITTLISCGIASKTKPINGCNTVVQGLDSTLKAFGIDDLKQRQELEATVRLNSERTMAAMMQYVETMPLEDKGELLTQIDIIGIDYFLTDVDGKLTPVAIEINGHDCTNNCQQFDTLANLYRFAPIGKMLFTCVTSDVVPSVARYNDGIIRGRSVRPFIRNMVARSQRHIMMKKKLLVIGAGSYSKRNIWTSAESYGIDVILVESKLEHTARQHVYKFIHFDFCDHKRDAVHAKDIMNILLKEDLHVDGCVAFWEDCVPLAAMVSEILGTNGFPIIAAYNAKQKSRTQQKLLELRGEIPHWPRAYLYASEAERIKKKADCPLAADNIGFPSILKLEHGSSAVGVCLVNNVTELQNKTTYILETLHSEEDYPGIGLGFDNSLVLTEFHDGSEHDVDIVLFERKLVAAFISDNGPTNEPLFLETAAMMPSSLPTDKQAQLVAAAFQCCTEIGLSNGTFNVEMKMTSVGPKLIEINARMGGFYIREWLQHLYGVDLMLAASMIACGIKPQVPVFPAAEFLMGIMLLPSQHRHIWQDKENRSSLQAMHANGELIITMFSDDLEESPLSLEEPFANIAVRGKTVEEAREKLLKLCDRFEITSDSYKVMDFVKHF